LRLKLFSFIHDCKNVWNLSFFWYYEQHDFSATFPLPGDRAEGACYVWSNWQNEHQSLDNQYQCNCLYTSIWTADNRKNYTYCEMHRCLCIWFDVFIFHFLFFLTFRSFYGFP
jgi:hypothetical protein